MGQIECPGADRGQIEDCIEEVYGRKEGVIPQYFVV